MDEKITLSELFSRQWQLIVSRYRALLAPILIVMLPYSILSCAMSVYATWIPNRVYSTIAGAAAMEMATQYLVLAAMYSALSLISIFVAMPACYSMYIILLYPGVGGMEGLRHAFKRYGKALGNTLFSFLPIYIAAIPLGIIVGVLIVPVVIFLSASGMESIPVMVAVFVLLIIAVVAGVSAVAAYCAQMLPLSLRENTPITSTFSLSAKRAKRAVAPYMAIMAIYYFVIFGLTTGIVILQQYSMEGYIALFSVVMIGTAFLTPFVYALNCALYMLKKEKLERENTPVLHS